MNSNSRYTIYPGRGARVMAHLVAWIFIFSLFAATSKTLFGTGITDRPVLIYSGIVLTVVLFNHYFLILGFRKSLIFLPGWLVIIFKLFLCYIFSAYATIFTLGRLAAAYPENHRLHFQYEGRKFHHFSAVFSYETLIWLITVVIFYNLILYVVKEVKDAYEANQDRRLLIQENMYLELNFLRSQIQPHFLFNTLNNIYGLVLDNQRASESILKLSDLLRFSLYESTAPYISLQRESEFLADYINLEKMRHTSRVNMVYDLSGMEHTELVIAPLLLVNFVENAFKHGVNASIGKVWVKINLKTESERIIFTIENNKPEDFAGNAEPAIPRGLGLPNTRRRLDLLYPGKHQLNISDSGSRYSVELIIYNHE